MKYLVTILSIVAFLACNTTKKEKTISNELSEIQEGKRLITTLGCNDCHSPKKMTEFGPIVDEQLLLSGHPKDLPLGSYNSELAYSGHWILFSSGGTAAIGPWGTSYASNLTPSQSGIGNWTFEQFKRAMQEGKSKVTSIKI